MRYLGQHVEETVNICIAVTEPPRIDERKEGIFEAMGNDTRDSGGKSLKIFIVSKDVWDSVVVLIHTVNDENECFLGTVFCSFPTVVVAFSLSHPVVAVITHLLSNRFPNLRKNVSETPTECSYLGVLLCVEECAVLDAKNTLPQSRFSHGLQGKGKYAELPSDV